MLQKHLNKNKNSIYEYLIAIEYCYNNNEITIKLTVICNNNNILLIPIF